MELTKNKKILYFVIFFIFAITTFFIGINHEPWADEAQAWLVSRDNSVFNLIFNVLRYEGHPCLWYLVLKTFNFIHFPYRYIFAISWGITLVGIYLFLFKIKCPTFIKILFPFTFFIFYQYNIIARDYCLMLPIFCLTIILYKVRFERPFWYAFSLVLLTNITFCTYIIGCFVLLYSIIDLLKQKKLVKKYILPIILVIVSIFFTALCLITPSDCSFAASTNFFSIENLGSKFIYLLVSSYFNTYKDFILSTFQIIVLLFLYIRTIQIFCKNKLQVSFFVITNLAMCFLLSMIYYNRWHFGFLIMTLIFFIMWFCQENDMDSIPFKKYPLYYFVVIFLFLLQISWSVKSGVYDINNNYASGKDVADFIKEHNYTKDMIEANGYKVVVVQPYFSENMFKNFPDNTAHWKWKFLSNHYRNTNFNLQSDIVIIDKHLYILNADEIKYLEKNFVEKIFPSKIYLKGYIIEDTSLSVFIRKK